MADCGCLKTLSAGSLAGPTLSSKINSLAKLTHWLASWLGDLLARCSCLTWDDRVIHLNGLHSIYSTALSALTFPDISF